MNRHGIPLSIIAAALAGGAAFANPASVPAPMDLGGVWEHPRRSMVAQPTGEPGPKPVQGPGNYGDYTNPNLKPHAAEAIRKFSEAIKAGGEILSSQQECMPVGIPRINNVGPYSIQILQEKDSVTFLYEYDHHFRVVYLNEKHPDQLKPTWLGHAVGHYEGDTLVIDTVKQNDKTNIDIYGTPHSQAMHVTERFRLIDGGKTLELRYTIDDPETFHAPWTAVTRFTRKDIPLLEHVCAENPRTE